MKRVYTTDNVAMAWHIRNVLEQHGIQATVRNEKLYSIAGEMPITECMPEVWVGKLDFSRAERIIREVEIAAPVEGPDWICQDCGESVGASFDICWNCQHGRGDEAGSDGEGDLHA